MGIRQRHQNFAFATQVLLKSEGKKKRNLFHDFNSLSLMNVKRANEWVDLGMPVTCMQTHIKMLKERRSVGQFIQPITTESLLSATRWVRKGKEDKMQLSRILMNISCS